MFENDIQFVLLTIEGEENEMGETIEKIVKEHGIIAELVSEESIPYDAVPNCGPIIYFP